MKIADKLKIFDHIDEKYVVEATPKRFLAYGAVKTGTVVNEHHPFKFLEGLVSAAAIFLVIGVIFVWTLVGKDLLGKDQIDDTTSESTTTQPQTTPNNVVVPPITTTAPITTTVPITTTAPVTTTPVTTTPPVTTAPPGIPITPGNYISISTADPSLMEGYGTLRYSDDLVKEKNWNVLFTASKNVFNFNFFTINEDEFGCHVGDFLITLDIITPSRPIIISTYLNDATCNRGFSFVDSNGITHYFAIEVSMEGDGDDALSLEKLDEFSFYSGFNENRIIAQYINNGCPDDLLPWGIQGKVSENELDKIKAFFSDLTTLRFIPSAYPKWDYFSSNDIYLNMVIIASFAPRLSEVSEEERLLLPENLRDMDPKKLTTAQIKELYKKYLGVDFTPDIHAVDNLYLEAYDSYYHFGTGVEGPFRYFENFCAWSMENGNVVVLLEDENGSMYFATLKPTSDSYIILQAFDIAVSDDGTQPPIITPSTPPVTDLDAEELLKLNADDIIELIKKAGCPEDKLPASAKSKVTDKELEKIVNFLKDPDAMSFINSYRKYDFFSPEDMDLAILLYNNYSRRFDCTREEWYRIATDIKIKYPDHGEVYDLMRLTSQECDTLVKKYLGLDSVSDRMKDNLDKYGVYLESDDAYYADNGGVLGFMGIDSAKAWKLKDGNILVVLCDLDEAVSTVVLKPKGNSYLFVQSVFLNN